MGENGVYCFLWPNVAREKLPTKNPRNVSPCTSGHVNWGVTELCFPLAPLMLLLLLFFWWILVPWPECAQRMCSKWSTLRSLTPDLFDYWCLTRLSRLQHCAAEQECCYSGPEPINYTGRRPVSPFDLHQGVHMVQVVFEKPYVDLGTLFQFLEVLSIYFLKRIQLGHDVDPSDNYWTNDWTRRLI